MSHYSIMKIKLKNVNEELLIEAVKELAKEINAQIVDQIHDYYGRVRTDFLIALKNSGFYRGVGIRINQETGEVELVGDFYGYRVHPKALEKLIAQYYTAAAVAYAARSLGMQVSGQKVEDKIYMRCIEA